MARDTDVFWGERQMTYKDADEHERYTDDAAVMWNDASCDERMRGYRDVGNVPEQFKENLITKE